MRKGGGYEDKEVVFRKVLWEMERRWEEERKEIKGKIEEIGRDLRGLRTQKEKGEMEAQREEKRLRGGEGKRGG